MTREEQALFNLEIKKKSGLSINPDIHHSKVLSSVDKRVIIKSFLFLNDSSLRIKFFFVKNQNILKEMFMFIRIHFFKGQIRIKMKWILSTVFRFTILQVARLYRYFIHGSMCFDSRL